MTHAGGEQQRPDQMRVAVQHELLALHLRRRKALAVCAAVARELGWVSRRPSPANGFHQLPIRPQLERNFCARLSGHGNFKAHALESQRARASAISTCGRRRKPPHCSCRLPNRMRQN